MAIESAQDRLNLLNDFGISVTLPDTSTITAIFDNQPIQLDNGQSVISTSQPMIISRTSDVSSLIAGSTITVEGTTYYVEDIRHDGTGMTEVHLRK